MIPHGSATRIWWLCVSDSVALKRRNNQWKHGNDDRSKGRPPVHISESSNVIFKSHDNSFSIAVTDKCIREYKVIPYKNIIQRSNSNYSISCQQKYNFDKNFSGIATVYNCYPLDNTVTNKKLQDRLFHKAEESTSDKRMPDFYYIRKELLHNGVTRKLLWTEYLEGCRRKTVLCLFASLTSTVKL